MDYWEAIQKSLLHYKIDGLDSLELQSKTNKPFHRTFDIGYKLSIGRIYFSLAFLFLSLLIYIIFSIKK